MIDPVYVLLHVFCIEKVVIENISSYLQLQKANKTGCVSPSPGYRLRFGLFTPLKPWNVKNSSTAAWPATNRRHPRVGKPIAVWKNSCTNVLKNHKHLYQKGYYTTLSIRNPAHIKRLSKGGWSERFHGYWSIRSWLHDGDFLEKQIIWKNLR